jgi:hypothetical protein
LALPVAFALLAFPAAVHGVQGGTLLRRQRLTHAQQHQGARLVQRRSNRFDAVDLLRHD